MHPITLFVLFAIIAIAIFAVSSLRRRSGERGWRHGRNGAGSSSLLTVTATSPIAIRGSSASKKGTAATPTTSHKGGSETIKVCAFDYHYTTGSGKSQSTHRFSGVMVTTNLPLKPLWIRSETIFDRVAGLVGMEPIQLESAEFNQEFHVTSPDRRWAFDVLPQSTMEFLLDSPKFTLEIQLCQILAYRDGFRTPVILTRPLRYSRGFSPVCRRRWCKSYKEPINDLRQLFCRAIPVLALLSSR